MSAIKTNTTIPKNVSTQDDLDFQFLKKIGIEYIQSLGGNLWTDFNTHDPGMTIVDLLCYAISDLGNRIELPIENLLSKADGTGFETQFYTADQILPNRSTTALDYRKLFIDIDGVRNCWLRPHKRTVYADSQVDKLSYDSLAFVSTPAQYRSQFDLKGLYDVLIDFDIAENIVPGSPAYLTQVAAITQQVKNRYHANRNLCEDLIDVMEIETQPISVCANIELEREADEEKVHAQVLFAIQRYFAPSVNFYSLKEMMARGYRTDQIFEGPILDHGFIDTEELRKSSLRTEVRLSDIMNLISSVPGVKVIKDIVIGNCDGKETDDWLICIKDQKRPVLCDNSIFGYRKDVLPLVLEQAKVDAYLQQLWEEVKMNRELSGLDKELTLPTGKYLDTDWYTTIQNDLPDTYGIGRFGLPSTASTARKAQAKQLKSYLLFFDQVLASYFAQLGVVKDLLSFDSSLKRTYYTQAVEDIKGFDDLVAAVDYPVNDPDLLSEKLFGDLDNINERRNQLLDHLTARFAEKFSEYTFLMKQLYGTASTELIVKSKQDFLRDYVRISANRGGAFNFYHQPASQLWDTDNVSGSEERIARLAGFKEKDFWRRNVSDSFVQVYTQVVGTEMVYRWRIRNEAGNIVLTSTVHYPSIHLASIELYQAVLQLIQTSEALIQETFDAGGFTDGVAIGNIQVQISPTFQYSFDVLNPTAEDPDYVIGRQYTYYPSAADLCAAILDLIEFMKFRFSEEGIFIVEHILLRPNVKTDNAPSEQFMHISLDDCADCSCEDPYSFKVSIILPGYTQRFSNMDFRNFLEELIREEIPSHIAPKICWVGERKGEVPDADNELVQFEKTYKAFLQYKSNPAPDPEQGQKTSILVPFITALENLHTIYPIGRLNDCSAENLIDGKIILDRTNLGTL